MDLKDIKSPRDIKNLDIPELKKIASQMRDAILFRCSEYSGHVGSNLGDAEAVLALHYVFDAPTDRLVYDVSHQDFPHKMLTGRVGGFIDKNEFDNVGEYTDPKESPEYDIFYAGHTSPALSLCVGLAKARDLKKENYNIVAFVGDGSLSGGEALEGLDAGGTLNSNLILVFNDNQMSIAENHGGMYEHFRHLRETNGTASDNLFKAFGWDYIYVADGNNLEDLIDAYKKVKDSKHPVVVHINTQKGEGYAPAEEYREKFHWMMPFDIATGEDKVVYDGPNYEGKLLEFIEKQAAQRDNFLVISSATPGGFGLTPEIREKLGEKYMDVAIAEQTGVAVMSGAARNGAKVVYAVLGTFLQRAYDQLQQDWAMNDSPALLVVLSTGIDSITDVTHLGLWDIPMIASIPDIVYLAPTNVEELESMLEWAINQNKYKVAVRMPGYSLQHAAGNVDTDYSDINRFKVERAGDTVALIGTGSFYARACKVAEILAEKGINATIINPRFVSGVDKELLDSLHTNHKLVATLEDGSVEGGFGQRVASALGDSGMKVLNFGVAKKFVDRYKVEDLEKENGLLPKQIADSILKSIE